MATKTKQTEFKDIIVEWLETVNNKSDYISDITFGDLCEVERILRKAVS